MKRVVILFIVGLAGQAGLLQAVPFVPIGYTIESYATGVGAVAGLTVDDQGIVYAADYGGGRLLQITGQDTVNTYASGIRFITDIAFRSDGRLFASSSIGPNSPVVEVFSDGSFTTYQSGFSYPVSIEARGTGLLVANSGSGVVSEIDSSGSVSTLFSGYSAPQGPFGLSVSDTDDIAFIDHRTGSVLLSEGGTIPYPIATVTSFGSTFLDQGWDGDLLISDTELGQLFRYNAFDGLTLFASGFAGKSAPPAIGPNGVAFDGTSLFVGDGDTIWRIQQVAVPEPATGLLFLIGILGVWIQSKFKNPAP